MISCYKLFFEHIWWGAAVTLSSFRKQPSVKIGNSQVAVRERGACDEPFPSLTETLMENTQVCEKEMYSL